MHFGLQEVLDFIYWPRSEHFGDCPLAVLERSNRQTTHLCC